jgi:ATP-dependent DNA helicase RecQ
VRVLERDRPFDEFEIDFETLDQRKKTEYDKLDRVIDFAQGGRCREQAILEYFGERNSAPCARCDNCRRTGRGAPLAGERQRVAATLSPEGIDVLRKALSGVARARNKGKKLVAQMLCGSKSDRLTKLGLHKLTTYGLLAEFKQDDIAAMLDSLLTVGCIEQVEIEADRPVLQLTPAGHSLMTHGVVPVGGVRLPESMTGRLTEAKTTRSAPVAADEALMDALLAWRQGKAEAQGVPRYRILTNAALHELARQRPQSEAELLAIKGIGDATVERFGGAILALLALAGGNPAAEVAKPPPVPQPAAPISTPTPSPISKPTSPSALTPPMPSAVGPTASEKSARGNFIDDRPLLTSSTEFAAASPEPASPGNLDDDYWTWRLLKAGFDVDECARIRGVARATVFEHALRAIDMGRKVELAWCFSPSRAAQLAMALGSRKAGAAATFDPLEAALFLKCQGATAGGSPSGQSRGTIPGVASIE